MHNGGWTRFDHVVRIAVEVSSTAAKCADDQLALGHSKVACARFARDKDCRKPIARIVDAFLG